MMGYRRNTFSPRGNRIVHVAVTATLWGCGGWIVAAIIADVGGDWVTPWMIGFALIFLWGHFHIKGAVAQNRPTYYDKDASPKLVHRSARREISDQQQRAEVVRRLTKTQNPIVTTLMATLSFKSVSTTG